MDFARRRATLLTVLLASCPLAPVAVSAQATAQEATLRWKFVKGQKYQLKMEQAMTQQMEMQGQPMKTSNNTTTYMTWRVDDVDAAGTASITSTIDRFVMEMDAPMVGQVQVDTDKEQDADGMATQLGGMLRPLVGVEFKQKMSPRGEISEVNIPDGAFAGMQGPLGQMGMNAQQIEDMCEKVSPKFPAGALEVGQTWKDQSVSETPAGKVEVANDYTYEGTTTVHDRMAHRIGIETKMTFSEGPNALGMTIKVTEQDTTGAMFFDVEKGQMIESDVDQKMQLKITAAGHDIQQRMQQKVHATFTEVGSGN